MTKTVTSDDVRLFLQNETWSAILNKIEQDQVQIFLNVSKDAEAREEAHSIICALRKIEQALQSVITEEKMQDRKEQRK